MPITVWDLSQNTQKDTNLDLAMDPISIPAKAVQPVTCTNAAFIAS